MNKINIVGLLALILGVVVIVAVFLDWASISLLGYTESVTGWEIFDDGSENTDYYYFPVVVLVLGILSVLTALVELMDYGSMITKILLIVFGAAIAVLAYLTFNDLNNEFKIALGGLSLDMAVGLYMAIAGGALLLVSGLYGLFAPQSN